MDAKQALDFLDDIITGLNIILTPDDAKDSTEALQALRKATQWQPMETAPKDRPILIKTEEHDSERNSCARCAVGVWWANPYDHSRGFWCEYYGNEAEITFAIGWKEVE